MAKDKQSPWDKENPEQAAKSEAASDPLNNNFINEMKQQAEQMPKYEFTNDDVVKAYQYGVKIGKGYGLRAIKSIVAVFND